MLFPQSTCIFLNALADNHEKAWFDANRARIEALNAWFQQYAFADP